MSMSIMGAAPIRIGDLVSVSFHNVQFTLSSRAEVLHIPGGTGDSWIFRDEDGNVHYISEGCTITKLRSST